MTNSLFKNIKTVYIDIDDTVWDFTSNSAEALRALYDNYIHSDSFDYFDDIYHKANSQLWELYHHGKIEKEFLITERFRIALNAIGRNDLTPKIKEINEWYLNNLANRKIIVPGAKELLQYLSEKYWVGALSNGFTGLQSRKLKSGNLLEFFSDIVLSDEVGVTKPLPGIFECALQRAGSNADSTLMIGDNYDADILGAHNAGWRTIHMAHRKPAPENSVATATVTNLSEIIGLL